MGTVAKSGISELLPIIHFPHNMGEVGVPADRLQDHLSYPPRGLRAARAAAYLGMSESSFLSLVDEGRLPQPKKVRGMVIWDRLQLDAAFETLEHQPRKVRNTVDDILGLDNETRDSD